MARVPLFPACAGISKASTAINVVLIVIAFWGLIAATRADFVWMAAHSALVFGILGIFTIYVFLTIAFGACVPQQLRTLPRVDHPTRLRLQSHLMRVCVGCASWQWGQREPHRVSGLRVLRR